MATQTINATIFASSHPDIVKRTSVIRLLTSGAMVVAGVLAFVLILQFNDKSSTGSMALMVTGAILVLAGIFRIFWKSEEMIYLPTGSVAKESSYFFDLKYMDRLTAILEKHQLDADSTFKSDASGNVRLDVMMSQDNKFAAMQLFQFVPYTYKAVTSICYFTGDEAAAICAFLVKCKTA